MLVVCGAIAAPAQTVTDLFESDALARIDVLVNSRDWAELKASFRDNTYYPADIRWNGITVRNVAIRSRGYGSRNSAKPGLRIDMNRYVTNQTFVGLTSFVLDNLTQDPTGIRERVAMRLFERMGIPAPREAHVQLYVNGRYAGLYVIVESIDQDFLRRVFGQSDGYLFEYQYTSAWLFDYLGPNLDTYAALLAPVTHETASTYEVYAPLEAMIRTINDSSDEDFVANVGQYIDLPLFMKHVAIQAFLADWDGVLGYAGVNNFYLYRFSQSTRSQLIPWDEDNSFHAMDYSVVQGHEQNVLMRRAMQVPELRAAYFDALLAAMNNASDPDPATGMGWLESEIVRELDLIGQSITSDTVKPYTNAEFATGVDQMIEFARLRPLMVRCELARLANPAAMPDACPAAAATMTP